MSESWWMSADPANFTAQAETRAFQVTGKPKVVVPLNMKPCACGRAITGVNATKCGKCRRKAGGGKSEARNRKGIRMPHRGGPGRGQKGVVLFPGATCLPPCENAISEAEVTKGLTRCRTCRSVRREAGA